MFISIVTVNFGFNSGLLQTLQSFSVGNVVGVEHIVVVSGLSEHDVENLVVKHSMPYRRFIINQDTSIYNAMNIGLKDAKGNFIFFLNGGDTFSDVHFLETIISWLNTRKCHLFRTNQIWGNDVYVRPSLKNLNNLLRHPAHQGFVAPLNEKTPRFDESRPIDADMIWMRQCINAFGADMYEDVIAKFYLGGVSNYPTLKTIVSRFKIQGIKRGFKEIFKFYLRKTLSDSAYYRLVMKAAGFPKIK